MAYLPLANILHYRLRSVLSALGIGIGICMLVTLSGLARGTLSEIGDRWEAVDADLIVYPKEWGENLVTIYGIGLSDRYVDIIRDKRGDVVQRVVPVFLAQMKLGGQEQTIAGVDGEQWATLTGGRAIREGQMYDQCGVFTRWMVEARKQGSNEGEGSTQPAEVADEQAALVREMADRGGMDIVIDSRLAAKGRYEVGQMVTSAGREWRISGIVPAGAMARVYMPRRTAQYLFGFGGINKSTLLFVKLKAGADLDSSAIAIANLDPHHLEVIPVRQYRGLLEKKFGVMFRYIDAVNGIAMVISFLFIMVTLYMMVLQRTREIAILKSCGADRWFILRQVVDESMILTGAGTAAGIGLSFLAAWAVEKFAPLYTVTITWQWIAVAVAVAVAGSLVSALYPAWRAMRVDMVEALTLE